ncbi:HAD family phosphatase [Clostridium sp. MD294]|uniref:HAD family hydrolase n=1 Tax=Clostridium sp. MD294 TaxID=97138 RepID=UPI0002CBDD6C|nr:HAD family phosphatase [Clostridium sp. MD294]NDO46158.1 HAD family phosphatase [Clostridium sp. MD294]USF30176.1 Phosphorylated carbohydrates phosphatase [Clostridium sp. MD294]
MRKFDAVIFDMDGLMVDTERIMQREVKEILKEMEFTVTDEIILKLIGLTDSRTKEVLEQEYGKAFCHNIFLKKLLERKLNVYHNEQICVKKGLWELVEFLEKENIKKIVATGTVRENMNLILKRTGLLEHFDLAVCGDEIEKGKPSPDVFIKAAEKLNVPKQRCLVLEDSQNGIIAAKSAGIEVIFIKDLVAPEKQYIEQVYAQCNDLSDVIQYLI